MSIMPIAPIPALGQITGASQAGTPSTSTGNGAQKAETDFTKFLSNALNQVNALQTNADNASVQLATGQAQDIGSVMVALEKANLSLNLAVSVRDKAIDAYNQIMRMQM